MYHENYELRNTHRLNNQNNFLSFVDYCNSVALQNGKEKWRGQWKQLENYINKLEKRIVM